MELRQRGGSCLSQRRGSTRRSSQGSRASRSAHGVRAAGVASAVTMKKDFGSKARKAAKFSARDDRSTIRSRDTTPRARAATSKPLSSTALAKQEPRERNGDGHASQARGGSRINLLLEKRALSKERGGRRALCKPGDMRSKDALETTAGGSSAKAEGRKLLSKVWPKPGTAGGQGRAKSGAANEDLPGEEHAPKPKGGRAKSRKRDRPSPRGSGTAHEAPAPRSPRRSPRGDATVPGAPNLEFQPPQEASARAAAASGARASTSATPRQSVITNIRGNVNDKMKLTSRLNAAVDDLIKMG